MEATGPDARTLKAGDAVMGIVAGGGQAEYLVTPEAHCVRIPAGMDTVTAGGVPEAFVTAHDAMFTQADLHPGARVLVHAVASGVGTAALQLACAAGATVVGTSRTKDKLDRAVELGLQHGILVGREFHPSALAAEITGAAGPADIVIDLVGGALPGRRPGCRRPQGPHHRGRPHRRSPPRARHGRAAVQASHHPGHRLTVPPAHEKAAPPTPSPARSRRCWPPGRSTPSSTRWCPLAEAERAYELMATDALFGKVVLDLR